ncbi:substrate-binding domain-containing protein [Magnetovirga frankeli]|uniref:substrate-binding domain-containing protein n=1 Tax=Magnetovirga frankeli TaxID=947516 RepID=UPI001AFC1A68|nr:substrate-binding domain-containing protein [gamma proteobacterium SS-5]
MSLKTLSAHALLLSLLLVLSGCGHEPATLLVYAGKGLKYPVEEIRRQYEQIKGVQVQVVYAGSDTLLATIRKTHRGDIYIPGSKTYLQQADDLVVRASAIAWHVPVFAISTGKIDRLRRYEDLLAPGVRIAIGNGQMAAIGRVADSLLQQMPAEQGLAENIRVRASTVNELIDLVATGQVDAALIWRDMLRWSQGRGLGQVPLPEPVNLVKEVPAILLSTSTAPDAAADLYDFIQSRGKEIFRQHGFER